jgi:ABC-type glycerol-3-phosphate transport system permease component
VVIAFAAAPLVWLARLSVTPDGETYAAARGFWPDSPTFDHYREVAGDPRFWRQLGNSMAVCLASTAVALLFGAWGAYGLARYRFRRRDALLTGLLALHLLPGVANMTAVYRLAELLGAIDSLLYVALLKSSGAAMAVWIMVATFRQIPDRLEFSARLDGLSSRQVLWRITLPLARPGLLTAGLLLFIQSWNSFFLPFLLLEEPSKMTLTVGMYRYFSEHGFEQGAVAAFVILALAPVVALFVVFRRFLWSPHEM